MTAQKIIFQYSFGIILVLMLTSSCEEARNWQLQAGENGALVVEGILTNEIRRQEIRLSLSYDGLGDVPPPVADAAVQVKVRNQSYPFARIPSQDGLYRSLIPFQVFPNLTYTLDIEWEGQTYQASSELSSVAPLPAIEFTPLTQNRDSLILATFAPIYNGNQQAMYEVNVDWSHLSDVGLTKARMLYYTFSSFDAGALSPSVRDTVVFPTGSIVIAKKFGLNDDFANYLRALVIETDWNGGLLFYSAPASLPTNISNGGLGFFSACAVVSDTIIAE